MSLRIPAVSTEFVKVPVSVVIDGEPQDISHDDAWFAIKKAGDPDPVDAEWIHTGVAWEVDNSSGDPVYYLHCLIGPGAVPPVAIDIGEWVLWVKVAHPPQIVVRPAGQLVIY